MKREHMPVTVTIEGEQLRLGEAIDKHMGTMLQGLAGKRDLGRADAVLSEFARRGLRMPELIQLAKDHPEWGVDPNVISQI